MTVAVFSVWGLASLVVGVVVGLAIRLGDDIDQPETDPPADDSTWLDDQPCEVWPQERVDAEIERIEAWL